MGETLADPILRLQTPTPIARGRHTDEPLSEYPNFEFPSIRLPDFSEAYDNIISPAPTARTGSSDNSGGGTHRRSDSMDADARKGMSAPDNTRPAPHQRRSRSTAAGHSTRRHAQQPPAGSGYPTPSSSTSDNAQNRPPTDFQPSSVSYPSPTTPYPPPPGFAGQQYTMPPRPPGSVNMSHTPAPYPFSHNFHHPDPGSISQNIHANYQPMHALPPVYPYQGQPSEGTVFSGTHNPTLYPSHQSHASSAPTTPHLASPISPPFVASSPFHSMQYPSTISMPGFRYSTPAYPSPSMYPSQYPSPGFSQHYTPNAEAEPQVAWYYFSHLASPQQYDRGPPYHQGHYTIGYPHSGHIGTDTTPFGSPGHPPPPPSHSSPGVAGPQSTHLNLTFSQYPEDQLSMDSPTQSGNGSPHRLGQNVDGMSGAAAGSVSGGSAMRQAAATDKAPQRRSYHPNPPAHRSEWVMWAGNVPSGATHDELWRFFTAPPDDQLQGDGGTNNGVLSIFLISRSSCAFVNYTSEEYLQQAIKRFDGQSLRPSDPRCPRLVCRVRGKGDDLKAGVGVQRGMGMHMRWLKEQKEKEKEMSNDSAEVSTSDGQLSSPGSISDSLTRAMSAVSLSSGDDDGKRLKPTHSNSSGSYASTTSSFFAKHFPKRYFILKSLTQEDLDLSVERGIWATQKHNEEVLDKAFRTSQEVYLIFGVNKSREFYGYARMSSSVIRDVPQDIQWAARPPPHPRSLHSSSPSATPTFFSPSDGRLVDNSPMPIGGPPSTSNPPGPSNLRHSAPPLLGQQYHKPTFESPKGKQQSLDTWYHARDGPGSPEGFHLDESAPARAMRVNQGLPDAPLHHEGAGPSRGSVALHAVAEEEFDAQGAGYEADQAGRAVIQPSEDVQRGELTWGDSFAVEWINTTRLSFAQTRHLRNPWNRGKEIKVSRDGTELEPSVGEQLLSEWPTSAT
ncbi:hypothetical protein BDN70DRAFT_929117 [Pholiota conissans]|uniref:YTH domain-containing protein n=1 Tax=Pholiota conissans TaxID=109636 RepID=A0A9P5ZBR4_9AGAR|nr:hypothetical protein BDN70DRAFT_929117 [Pholiota conissans]